MQTFEFWDEDAAKQRCNSRGRRAVGQSAPPPDTSYREISAEPTGKREARKKKGKWRRKEGKLKKGSKKGRWNGRVKSYEIYEESFSFFFFFTFHFSKVFCVYQNGNFLLGKGISCWEKKSGKMTLPPLKNTPLTPLLPKLLPWSPQ